MISTAQTFRKQLRLAGVVGGWIICGGVGETANADDPPKVKVDVGGISYLWAKEVGLTPRRWSIEPSRASFLIVVQPGTGGLIRSSIRGFRISRFETDKGVDLRSRQQQSFLHSNYADGDASFEIKVNRLIPRETQSFLLEGVVFARIGWGKERLASKETSWKPGLPITVGGITFTVDRWEFSHPESDGGRLFFTTKENHHEILEAHWVEQTKEKLISTGAPYYGDREWGPVFLDWKPGPGKLEILRWEQTREVEIPFSIEFGWTGSTKDEKEKPEPRQE